MILRNRSAGLFLRRTQRSPLSIRLAPQSFSRSLSTNRLLARVVIGVPQAEIGAETPAEVAAIGAAPTLAWATPAEVGETGEVAMSVAAILAEVGEISDRRSRPVGRAKVRLALVVGDRDLLPENGIQTKLEWLIALRCPGYIKVFQFVNHSLPVLG
jgi:hypothetical protein